MGTGICYVADVMGKGSFTNQTILRSLATSTNAMLAVASAVNIKEKVFSILTARIVPKDHTPNTNKGKKYFF